MGNLYKFYNDDTINNILNDCWLECYNDIKEYNLRKVDGDLYPIDFLNVIEQTYKLEKAIQDEKNKCILNDNLWEYCNSALIKIIEYLCNKYDYSYKINPDGKDEHEIVVYKKSNQQVNIVVILL